MKKDFAIIKEQLFHMAIGTVLFAVLATLAVMLDLASKFVETLGVSHFTFMALELTAHGLLIVDLALFVVYMYTSSVQLVKEMIK